MIAFSLMIGWSAMNLLEEIDPIHEQLGSRLQRPPACHFRPVYFAAFHFTLTVHSAMLVETFYSTSASHWLPGSP